MYEITSGNIAEGVEYQVTGTGAIIYNSVTVSAGAFFTGVSGVTTYTVDSGTPFVTEASTFLGFSLAEENDFYLGHFNDESRFLGISISTQMDAIGQIIRTISTKQSASVNDYIFTINTTLGTGTPDFTLPTVSGQTYDAVIDWGDFNITNVTAYNSAGISHTYVTGGTYQIKISGKFGGWSFNNTGDKDKITSVDQGGNVEFDYLVSAFKGCSNLTHIYSFNINAVNSLVYFTSGCCILEYINTTGWDTSNVVYFSGMAYNNYVLNDFDVSNFDTSLGTHFNSMFQRNRLNANIDISNFDMSNAIDISYFMSDCEINKIADTSNWVLNNLTSCINAFFGNDLLESYFDASKWWNNTNITSYLNAFTNDRIIQNYSDIPNTWKGL